MPADLVIEVKIKNSTASGAEEAKRSVRGVGDEAENTAKKTRSLANVDFSAIKQNLNNLGDKIKNIGSLISGLGQQMSLALSAPILGLAILIGKIGITYESALNSFQAVTNATADEMRQAAQAAKDLGADITLPATSAKDAALAMEELGKSGLTAAQSIAAAKAVLQLAAAGELDEAKAAEVVGNAINAFRLNAEDAVRVSDLLAGAANSASGGVTDMAQAFQQSAATFAASKVPIEDLTTAIALMAKNGIKGSDAGTSLKTFLSSIQAPSDSGASSLEKLGIKVFDLQGKMKSLPDIIGQFEKSLSKLTDQEKVEAIQNIFGADASRAAQILFRDGAAGFEKVKQAVTQTGAAADLAKAKTKGLGGAWEALKSQAETVGITIFEALKNPAEQAVRFLADNLGKVSDYLAKLSESNPEIIQLGAVFLGIVAAAGPLLIIFGTLIGFIGTIVSGVGTLMGVLAPLGAFIISFVGLIGEAGLVASFSALASVLTGTVTTAVSPVLAGLASLLPVILGVAAVIGVLIGAGVALYAAYQTNFGGIRDLINDAMATIQQTIQNALQFILNFWQTYGSQIMATAINTFQSIKDAVEPIVTELVSYVRQYFGQIAESAAPILAQLSTLFKTKFEQIKVVVQIALFAINQFWKTHGEQIIAVVSAAWTILKTVVLTGIKQIGNVITLVLAVINGDWSQAWTSFKSILQTSVSASITIFSSLIKIIYNILKSIVLSVISFGREIGAKAFEMGKNLGEGLANGISSLKDRVVSAATSLITAPLSIFRSVPKIQSPSKVTTEIGEFIGEGLAVGMESKADRVRSAAKRVANEAVKAMRDAMKEFQKLAGASPETISTIQNTDRVKQATSDQSEIIKLRGQLNINQSLPLPSDVAGVESEISMLRQRVAEAEKYNKTLDDLRNSYNELQDAAEKANLEFTKKIEAIQQSGNLELLNLREEVSLTGVIDEHERRRIQNVFEILRLREQMANDGYGQKQIDEAAEALRIEQARASEWQRILDIRKQVAKASELEKDLTERLSDLQNGNRELSEYEKTLKKINTDLKDISPQQRENLLILAQQIDAQKAYNKAYEKTYDFIRGTFETLADSGKSIKEKLSDIFGGIFSSFKKMLFDMAAAWLSSKLLSILGMGNGGGQSGGGLRSILGGIFGGGGSGGIFGGNQGGAIFNFGSSASGSPSGGSQGGFFGALRNLFGGGGSKQTEGAGPASSGLGGAGIASLIGVGANIIGGLIGGRIGGAISGAGSGIALGATIGSIVPGIGTVIGAAVGGIIGFFGGLFGDKKKKIDKKENMPKLQDGFREAFDQLKQLAADKNAFYNDPEGTIEKAKSLRQQIASGFGIQFQSKKYKNQAQEQITQKLAEADRMIAEMQKSRDQYSTARTIDSELNANFATGIYLDKAFLKQYSQFKRRNGMLAGQFTGRDILPSYLAEGEMVLNPYQIARVVQNADGRDVFKGAGIPGYSTGTFVGGNNQQTVASSPSSSPSSGEKQPLVIKIYQSNSGMVESEILDTVIEGLQGDYELQTEVVKTYDKIKSRIG